MKTKKTITKKKEPVVESEKKEVTNDEFLQHSPVTFTTEICGRCGGKGLASPTTMCPQCVGSGYEPLKK